MARFIIQKTRTGTLMVKDEKNGSIVCTMSNAGRPFEHTEKMAEICVAALNKATQGGKE